MAVGITIDSGEMSALFETALQRADWGGFAERREAARNKGLYRGIGLGMYLEKSGDGSDGGVHISFGANGHMTVLASQQCNGQGHRMTLTQILSDKLGYDADKITIQQGDSSTMPEGTTGGARMTVLIGSAATKASGAIIDLARPLVAEKLDCAAENLIFDDGIFADKTSNRSITLEDLVIALADDGTQHVLDMRQPYASDGPSYPYGCHIAEVEIDPATCKVKLDRFTCVNDFGVVINPVMLEGQIQGGIVQGIGQALYEHVVYDDQGQLLAGSLMDYTLPRADHIPMFDISMRNTPCLNNVLGVKGAGQAGAIGAPHAVISAICNALSIPHIDMPATPASIWRVIKKYNVTGV
jgi:carbon-monoxide dehydrogenase large subunit